MVNWLTCFYLILSLNWLTGKPGNWLTNHKPVVSHSVSGRDVKSAYEIKGAKNSPHKQRE